MIVDSVSDIVTIPADALQPPPATSGDAIVPFLEGLVAIESRMAMILDLKALGAGEELAEAA